MKNLVLKKITVLVLAFSLLFSSGISVFADGNNNAGNKQSKEGVGVDPDQVLKDYAGNKGKEYGEMLAGRDYMKGLKGDPTRHFNSRESVYNYFKIKSDSSHNKTLFYEFFIKAFKSTYEASYIEISMQDRDNNETFWFGVAKKYASIEGEMAAYHDHLNELSENWERAYKNMIVNEGLNERFRLFRYSGNLPENFELDFKSEFKFSYKVAFANAIVKDNELNSNYYYIDSIGKEISYQRVFSQMEKASISDVSMPKVTVTFPERAILERTPMSIRYKQNRNRKSYQSLIPLSDIYELEIQRGKARVKFHAPVSFTVQGFGVRGAGIYKWNHDRWDYVYTVIEDKLLKTSLQPGIYSNTDFCVFIDENYIMPSDIAFSWAYKELYTAIRRHNVPQTEKFYPDSKITKLQLADQIYRIMSHREKKVNIGYIPQDVQNFKDYHNAVSFVLGKGYMSTDANGNFLPASQITYQDFEYIMQNVYLKNFSMKAFAEDMLQKKYHRSDYLTKKSKFISRAEATYGLYKYLD